MLWVLRTDNNMNTNLDLLVEHWDNPIQALTESEAGSDVLVPLVESIDQGKGKLYIEGIFMQAEKLNGNRRIYPKAVLEKAVDRYIKTVVARKQALGETNHPPRPNVDPSLASIIIEDLWWVGNNVHGRARVIEGDGGPGDKLAANIRAGWVPGLSSRGLGTTKRDPKTGNNYVNEGFIIGVAADVVMGPSAPDAYASAYVTESVVNNNNINSITESGRTNSDDEAFKQLTEALSKKFESA